MNFGAHFARDTRPAPEGTVQKSQDGAARVSKHLKCFCAPLLRVARTFRAKIAQFFGRNSRDFARKIFKFSAMAATDACANREKHTNHL